MERKTFLIVGVLSIVVVVLGFIATLMNQYILSLILIAWSAITFYIALRKAKKEPWFGKPVQKSQEQSLPK